jgi:hypothetical protein
MSNDFVNSVDYIASWITKNPDKAMLHISKELADAEARGYRRGVEDAAKHLEAEADFEVAEASAMLIWAAAKLRKLADAEQTSDTNPPHPENGTGLKSEM